MLMFTNVQLSAPKPEFPLCMSAINNWIWPLRLPIPKKEAFSFVKKQIHQMYEEAVRIEEKLKKIESETVDDGLFD